jgi:hypothetical protein
MPGHRHVRGGWQGGAGGRRVQGLHLQPVQAAELGRGGHVAAAVWRGVRQDQGGDHAEQVLPGWVAPGSDGPAACSCTGRCVGSWHHHRLCSIGTSTPWARLCAYLPLLQAPWWCTCTRRTPSRPGRSSRTASRSPASWVPLLLGCWPSLLLGCWVMYCWLLAAPAAAPAGAGAGARPARPRCWQLAKQAGPHSAPRHQPSGQQNPPADPPPNGQRH